jgi:hypothetical protein
MLSGKDAQIKNTGVPINAAGGVVAPLIAAVYLSPPQRPVPDAGATSAAGNRREHRQTSGYLPKLHCSFHIDEFPSDIFHQTLQFITEPSTPTCNSLLVPATGN